jgi:hypothetical protein
VGFSTQRQRKEGERRAVSRWMTEGEIALIPEHDDRS